MDPDRRQASSPVGSRKQKVILRVLGKFREIDRDNYEGCNKAGVVGPKSGEKNHESFMRIDRPDMRVVGSGKKRCGLSHGKGGRVSGGEARCNYASARNPAKAGKRKEDI